MRSCSKGGVMNRKFKGMLGIAGIAAALFCAAAGAEIAYDPCGVNGFNS